MKNNYSIPSDSGGWPAKTWLEPERAFDEIFSMALIYPSGYLGITSDHGLAFKGVTIRFGNEFTQFGCPIYVEIIDLKRITEGFYDMYMALVDRGIVLGEPSERISLPVNKSIKGIIADRMKKVKKFANLDMTIVDMAERLGVSTSTIKRALKLLGIKLRELRTLKDHTNK